MRLRQTLAATSLILIALLASAYGLLASNAGLHAVAAWLSGPQLSIQVGDGNLLGPFQIERMSWRGEDGLTIELEEVALDWSPINLLKGGVKIEQWHIRQLKITPATQSTPSAEPASLYLLLAFQIAGGQVEQLHYGNWPAFTQVRASFESDGQHHRLSNIHLRNGQLALTGEAVLAGSSPLNLTAHAELQGEVVGKPLRLALDAEGPLRQILLKVSAKEGILGSLTGELTPFASAPFSRLALQLNGIDPSAWQNSWPHGAISAYADLQPAGAGVGGQFQLINQNSAKFDQAGLPIRQVAGQLHWAGEMLELTRLHLQLPGNGSLQGQARWQGSSFNMQFAAQQVDVAQLHSRLRPTRLAGLVAGQLSASRQQFRLDLHDPRFNLRAEGMQQGAAWQVPRLEIAAGEASLSGSAHGRGDGLREFALDARLQAFDPARFARLPSARINANLKVSGQLLPHWQAKAEFQLAESQLVGMPFKGAGRFHASPQGMRDTDVQLSVGENHLLLQGALGQRGDELRLEADFAQLAALGLGGSLKAQATLAGSLADARFKGNLNSPQLTLPDGSRLRELSITAALGKTPDAAIGVALQLARLDRPNVPSLLRDFTLRATGRNDQHQLELSTLLPDGDHLQFSAQGGSPDLHRWQGEIKTLQLDGAGKQTARNFRLNQPAKLLLSEEGWRLGPLQLRGMPLDWQASLTAQAERQNLKLELSAKGSRIGELQANLGLGMDGPYRLAPLSPWQGQLKARVPDLTWLGEAIGESWQSSGSLNVDLKLSGSPEAPRFSGRIAGDSLGMQLPETGLRLTQGQLAASLSDNVLTIEQLRFSSPWQNQPRQLRKASVLIRDPDALKQLTETPGQLILNGQIRLKPAPGEQPGTLHLKLDRVGVYQLADRWVSVSGETAVNLQASQVGVHGAFTADAGYWQLAPGGAPRLSDDVVVRRSGETQENGWRPRLDIDLNTRLGDRFIFEGLGLSTRLSGEVRITARDRDLPRASGSINSRQGSFSAYGQKLEIDRGSLHFRGLLDNPALDVRALRKGLAVEAGVQISGTVQKPSIRLVSDPELPDAEKLSWLILGHGPEQGSSADATVLLAAAGGLLGNDAGKLIGQLKKIFSLDEFAVRQGRIGENSAHTSTSRVAGSSLDNSNTGSQIVSIGKRLSSNALLSYEQSIGRAESVVKLAVRLSQRLTLVGRAGSDNALDLFYTLFFGREEGLSANSYRRE